MGLAELLSSIVGNSPDPSRVTSATNQGARNEVSPKGKAPDHAPKIEDTGTSGSAGAPCGVDRLSHVLAAAIPTTNPIAAVPLDQGDVLIKRGFNLSHDEVVVARCLHSLSYFVRVAWPFLMPGITLHWNWHLDEMCRHVQGMLVEWMRRQDDPTYVMKAQNLAINCPPRSLKSTIVSVCAPAWMWLHRPAWKALFLSANPRIATRDANASIAFLRSPWYTAVKKLGATMRAGQIENPGERERARAYLDWELVSDGVGDVANSSGGHRMAMGFTAVVVGLGGDAIFVDDPNDTKKVMGEPERAKINDTWDLSLCNRVNSYTDSIRILIMQRCHELDLTGHWKTVMPDELTVYLAMPLEYDEEMAAAGMKASPFGYVDPRKTAGEIIHPIRFTELVIAGERKRLGPYGFAGQMNQKPVPLEGGAFKRGWWNFCYLASAEPHHHPLVGTILADRWCQATSYEDTEVTRKQRRPNGCDLKRKSIPIPFLDVLAITVDCTFGSEDDDASRVGMLCYGIKGADRFALEDRTKPMTFPETCEAIRQLKRDFPAATTILIEKKANGAAVIQTLTKEIGGCIAIEANDNWIVRANAMLPSVASGNWYILEGAQWAAAYVGEFAAFPKGSHDDRIDASSQLSAYFNAGGTLPDW